MLHREIPLDPVRRRQAFGLAAGALAFGGLLARPAAAATSGLVVIGKDGWLFPLWDATSRFDAGALHAATPLMNDTVTVLKGAGIEVVQAVLPAKSRLYRQFLPDDTKLTPDIDKRFPAILADLRKSPALVPDLDTVFRAVRTAQPALPVYFATDTHWTPSGAEIAAVELAKRIKEGLRLPPASRPAARLGAPTTLTNPVSDLVRFLPAEMRAKYPAETYQIREAQAAGGLLDTDDGADVVVVGNSFAQPKYGFIPLLAAQLDRPVGLAWRPNNYGPWFTLLEYLKGESFRRRRPKALVWMHLEFDVPNLPNSSSWGQNAMPPPTFLAEVKRAVGA
ncbi:MAG: alginate O-acetyltransferase AlgX-related protein [Paracraurococcus sp.]|jgi:alginate O-acetyltransferase complex protein AlgJ